MQLISLIFVAGLCWISAEAQTQTLVPPNCVCQNPSRKPICGSDGQQYNDHCSFTNAKFNNPNLGTRPCAAPSNPNSGREQRTVTVCLTTNMPQTDTMANIQQYLLANTAVGIRCRGNCPCQAITTCPGNGGTQHGMWGG